MADGKVSHDVFISYSRKNKDVVLPIKDEIERRLGLKCWIDVSDIPCGSDCFIKKVIPGIRQARVAFLFFLSTESQNSECAMGEIEFAKKRAQKRVILIRINDDEMTDEFFFKYQSADIIDWRAPEQREKLFRDLSVWASQAGQQSASGSSVESDRANVPEKSYGKHGIPLQESIDLVRDKFAHFLYANKGWAEFSVMEFETSNDYLIGYVVKNHRKEPIRLVWLLCSDIYRLIDIDEDGFSEAAEKIFCQTPIAFGQSVRDAWNNLAKAFMPALLFAYNVRALIYESERQTILIPLTNANPHSFKKRSDICTREFDGKDCVCVAFDELRLMQLIGKNRAECSELAIGWIKGAI